ncbi:MAG: carboxymuconolactone decarboxylase family protein [Pseudomonadota bacterium]
MTQRLNYNAIAPGGAKAFFGVYTYVAQSGLPAQLIELVYLRTSQINGCAYCIDMHASDLIKKGVAIQKLMLVQAWRDAGPLFDARERAALALTESVCNVALAGVPDVDYDAAAALFPEAELVDLTIAISLMNAYNRLSITFRNTPAAH